MEERSKGKQENGSGYIDETKTMLESGEQDTTTKPPDGGWGWVIVLSSFAVHFITDGISYSFGIFYYEFLEFYGSGKSETAWVGSLVFGAMMVFGPFAGLMADRFGCRITTCVGAIVTTVGFVLSTFSPNLYFLYFSFGILAGVGISFLYLTAVVSVNHYFEKKRALAIGIACCGSGFGAFVFNPFTKYLIDEYGWRGAILIEGGLILNCAVFGTLQRPLNPAAVTTDESITLPTDKLLLDNIDRDAIKDSAKEEETNVCGPNTADKIKHTIAQFCGFAQLRNIGFILFLTANVLASLGMNVPLVFLYDFAIERNIDADRAKWLGSIIGVTNTFGRAFCGVFGDRERFSKSLLFSVSLLVLGTATALCAMIRSYALMVVFSVVFGISYGAYVALMSVVLVDILGLEMLNNTFGLLLMFKGIANLAGPPLAGLIFDLTKSYSTAFATFGTIIALAGVALIPAEFTKPPKTPDVHIE